MSTEDTPLIDAGEFVGVARKRPSLRQLIRPCVAELGATALFVYVGSMAIGLGPATGPGMTSPIVSVAATHGFMIAILVASFGDISGGHVNPVVTLGVTLAGGLNFIAAPFYMVSQLIGGIIGAGMCRETLSWSLPNTGNKTIFEQISGGGQTVPSYIDPSQAVLCEVVLTMILVTVVLMTAVDTDGRNPLAPIAIGLAVFVDIMAGGYVSGASMNPARSFGPAVVSSDLISIWHNHWVYWVGPITGSLLATFMYRLLFGKPEKRLFLKED